MLDTNHSGPGRGSGVKIDSKSGVACQFSREQQKTFAPSSVGCFSSKDLEEWMWLGPFDSHPFFDKFPDIDHGLHWFTPQWSYLYINCGQQSLILFWVLVVQRLQGKSKPDHFRKSIKLALWKHCKKTFIGCIHCRDLLFSLHSFISSHVLFMSFLLCKFPWPLSEVSLKTSAEPEQWLHHRRPPPGSVRFQLSPRSTAFCPSFSSRSYKLWANQVGVFVY